MRADEVLSMSTDPLVDDADRRIRQHCIGFRAKHFNIHYTINQTPELIDLVSISIGAKENLLEF